MIKPSIKDGDFEVVVVGTPRTAEEIWLANGLPEPSQAALNLLATADKEGWIYFIQHGKNGDIKIGWTKDHFRRFKSLKTGCSKPLRLLGIVPGNKEIEKDFHNHFDHARMSGEWFKWSKTSDAIIPFLMDYGLTPVDVKSRNIPELHSLFSFYGHFTGDYVI